MNDDRPIKNQPRSVIDLVLMLLGAEPTGSERTIRHERYWLALTMRPSGPTRIRPSEFSTAEDDRPARQYPIGRNRGRRHPIGYDEWRASIVPFVANHGEDDEDDRESGDDALGSLCDDIERLGGDRLALFARLQVEYGKGQDPRLPDCDSDTLDAALLDCALHLDPAVRRLDEARFVAGKVKEHRRRTWLIQNRRTVHLNTVPTDDSYLDDESNAERRMRLAVLTPRRRRPIPSPSFEFRPDPNGSREAHGVKVSCVSTTEFNPPAWVMSRSRSRERPVIHNGPGGRFGLGRPRWTMPIASNRAAVFLSLARHFNEPAPEFAGRQCVAVGIAPLRAAGPVGAVVESPFDDYAAIFDPDGDPGNLAAVMTRVCPGWPTSPADRQADIVFRTCPDLVHAGRVGRAPIPRQPIRLNLARLLEGVDDPAAAWGALNPSERLQLTAMSACRSPLPSIIQRAELVRQRDGHPSGEHPLHELLRERLVKIAFACVRVYQGLAALGEALEHRTLRTERWRDAWRLHGPDLLLHLDGAVSRVENWNPDDLRQAVADGRVVPTGRSHNAVERLTWWIRSVNEAAPNDRVAEFRRRGPALAELVEVARDLQGGGVEATVAAYAATQSAEVLWQTIHRNFDRRVRAINEAANGIESCYGATDEVQDWNLSVVLRVTRHHAEKERAEWRKNLDGGIWPGRDRDVEDVVARVVIQTVPVPPIEPGETEDDAADGDDEQARIARWRMLWSTRRAQAVLRRTRKYHVKEHGKGEEVQYPNGRAPYTARNRCARLIPGSLRRTIDAVVAAHVDPVVQTTKKDR